MAERSSPPKTRAATLRKRKCDHGPAQRRAQSSKRSRPEENASRNELEGQLKKTPSVPSVPYGTYHIGWICALPIELAASRGMLDKIHDHFLQPLEDDNTYILGCIAHHNIVIACLPARGYGMSNAASVATNMRRTFRSIHAWLLVGIAGGAPEKVDVRLGDVVVSTSVLQSDLGKIEQSGKMRPTGIVRTSSDALLTAISALQAKHEALPSDITMFHQQMLQHYPNMAKYADPGADQDLLFDSGYEHEYLSGDESCDFCDKTKLVKREERLNRDPRIYYGTAASASQVIKHAGTRDHLSQELDISCFEMEAAGIIGSHSVVSIRGISDYSDSHKSKQWQRYAAATAAAYARELLSTMPVKEAARPEAQSKNQGKITAKNLYTDDNGRQVIFSGKEENIEAENWRAGKGSWQVIMSGDSSAMQILQSLAKAPFSDDEATEKSVYANCGNRSATLGRMC